MRTCWRWVGVFALALGWTTSLSAQQRVPNRTTDPLLSEFRWRDVGPIGQGGRVDDIAVVESDPRTYYVGFATAGIFKTENNGITYEQIFDGYGSASIGGLAVSQSNPNVVYVGTGEANNRQSSSFGDGMYKSTDAGRTFTHIGLRETQTIARVRVHPTNPDIVWVAANGHLFGPNPERGVYKTTDGGRTWRHVLRVDENTGATELIVDPSNPNILFTATYQRRRTACCFVSGGAGSGIWRSDDGGDTWTRLSGNGLPSGTMGRVTMAFAPSNPNVIYAQIEVAQDRLPAVAAQQGGRAAVAAAVVSRRNSRGRSTTASGARTTRAARGSSARIRTSGRCTSASSRCIRRIPTTCLSAV